MRKAALALRMARAAWAYRMRRTKLNYLPVRLWIDPVSTCNFKCIMCPNPALKETGKMSFDLYRAVIDESVGSVFDVSLYMAGEPLLNKQLEEMIVYAEERGIRTWVSTNASALTRDRARSLIQAGLSRLLFSVDGYTKEEYERIRIGGRFEKTMENVLGFLEERGNRSKPYTTVQVIELGDGKATDLQKQAFLDQFRRRRPDRIKIIQPHNFGGKFQGIGEQTGRHYQPCSFLWYSMNVMPDGRVTTCCLDLAGELTLAKFPDRSLKEIWNGPEMIEMRHRMIHRQYGAYSLCSDCDILWKPTRLGLPLGHIREYVSEHFLT